MNWRSLVLPMVLALGACSTQHAARVQPRYEADLTVLEGGGHGPQLCGYVNTSMPPQCSGPDVRGWDWNKTHHEAQGGVLWGDYHVVGTWDGSRFTLTEPPGSPGPQPTQVADFSSPCPAPPGGWRAVDPAKATQDAQQAAIDRAKTAKEYAGAWIDQGPGVLNLMFTGDLTGREAWIRQVWGGGLCVSGAAHSDKELSTIQSRLEREQPGFVAIGASVRENRVDLMVWVATPEKQHELDAEFGAGLVALSGMLRPRP